MREPSLPRSMWPEAIKLYLAGLPMSQVAERLVVSLDAITYVLRKSNIARRTQSEASKLSFDSKPVTYKINKLSSEKDRILESIGATLYWGEGYKSHKASGIDFANSDPEMVFIFLSFLRKRYSPEEKRIKILLYCYADQDIPQLITFWSKLLKIPKAQFTKPYIRQNYRVEGRKMKYGMVHIRYSDKKMLIDLLNLIESYKSKYRVGGRAVNYTAL